MLPTIDLSRVSLGQFIDYLNLLEKLEPKLKELFPEESPTVLDILQTYPEYVEQIVCFWTDWTTIHDKDADMVLGLFTTIQEHTQVPEPCAQKVFELQGEHYYAPADLKAIKDTIPMGKATFGQVLEALQLEQLAEGKHDMIPYVLASMYLKKGDVSGKVDITERGDLFKRLPVSTALNCYFFLASCASIYTKAISPSSAEVPMPKLQAQA